MTRLACMTREEEERSEIQEALGCLCLRRAITVVSQQEE
jgi:hypothetical protein